MIFSFTASISEQKVSFSISAKTGIAPYPSGATAVADFVNGDTITSSQEKLDSSIAA